MVRYRVLFGEEELWTSLPSGCEVLEAFPKRVEPLSDPENELKKVLENPIGSKRLSEIISRNMKVAILVDDYTRPTPAYKILPKILEELETKDIPDENIKIIIALGTHRPATDREIRKKVGDKIFLKYDVLNHDWRNRDALKYLGETKRGTPIWVNKEVVNSDIVIGIGSIFPHRVAGFSGGGKIVQPGVCGEETTGHTHWLSAQIPGERLLGTEVNPVSTEIQEVAKRVGLEFIVNCIMDMRHKVYRIVAGDPIKAWRRGCHFSREVYEVKIPFKADIVIAECRPPSDMDMWQAARAIYASGVIVKQGGTIILLAKCPKGISKEHPEVSMIGYQKLSYVKQLVRNGMVKDLVAAAHMVHVGSVIREKAKCILISEGIKRKEAEKIGFKYKESLEQAINEALARHGKHSRIVILHEAQHILPKIY